ncbi:MAG: ATP-binding protein [Bacteroidia bacterium]
MPQFFNPAVKAVSSDFYESVLDSTFHGVMTLKAIRNELDEIVDFNWIYINDVASRSLGLLPEDAFSSTLLKSLPAHQTCGLFEKYVEVVETQKRKSFEVFYSGDEVDSWFRMNAVNFLDGLTLNFQNISHLKEANIQAQSNELKFRQLFEESMDPIFVLDLNFRFEESNWALHQLAAFSKQELHQKQLTELFLDKENAIKFLLTMENEGYVEEFEFSLMDSQGFSKPCILNCSRLMINNNQLLTYVGVIRDISKRKQADQDLMIATKMSMTGKLARSIAHEVRNPLTNMMLALDQLKDEVDEQVPDADLYFGIIRRNADRVSNLISNLLNSSKPKDLNIEHSNLNELVILTLDLVKDRLKLQNIGLKTHFFERLPAIRVDRDHLQVALLNLFINAIEAMHSGTGILEVTTLKKNGQAILIISDNGPGIPAEIMDHLFEPFMTGKKDGTGLGLTTVQSIIQSHKARLDVQSSADEGTTFRITFPDGHTH